MPTTYRISRNEYSARLRVARALGFLATLTVVGTVGYHLIESWSWGDSVYMVFITLSTVGFREVHPLSDGGRIWTAVIVAGGLGSIGYTAASVAELFVDGHFYQLRRRHRMEKRIASMRDHIIVCGFGRVGQQTAADLRAAGREFVVIDLQDEQGELANSDIPYILGSAESEATLQSAGIDHARTLITAVDSDTENVFVTLTARVLNPNIRVIARASDEDAVRKLKLVGAERVISPYSTSGRRMAYLALLPAADDVFEVIADPSQELAVQVQRIEIADQSEFADRSLAEVDLRRRSGALVVALRRDDEIEWNPDPARVLHSGDVLTILGSDDQCRKMHELNSPRASA